MGLRAGIAVAVANVDAHVSAPAATVTAPGTLVAIMGTSICHVVLSDEAPAIAGMCGVVRDGVIPGFYGYEAGQPAVGDLFGWFVERGVPPSFHEEAERRGVTVHEVLADSAATLRPGESGLLALDWWNGNRSVLVDADLTGVLIGMTLATEAPAIYRALIEATAFGTRVIIDAFEAGGVRIDRVVACGGLPDRSPLLMQIFADVTGRSWRVAASSQTPALGAAMFAAVAAGPGAGGYATIEDAAAAMAHLRDVSFDPDPMSRGVYDALYAEYVRLHDLLGRDGDPVLKTLKRIRLEAIARPDRELGTEPAGTRDYTAGPRQQEGRSMATETTRDEAIAKVVESATRLGVELDEAEAAEWVAAMETEASGGELVVDVDSGVYGHRVTMLDFQPEDLARFREMATGRRLRGPAAAGHDRAVDLRVGGTEQDQRLSGRLRLLRAGPHHRPTRARRRARSWPT